MILFSELIVVILEIVRVDEVSCIKGMAYRDKYWYLNHQLLESCAREDKN